MCGTINGCISTGATEANLKMGSNLFGSRFTASRCCTRREKWLFSWRHCPPLTVAIAARVRSSSDSVSVWPHNWPAAVEEFAKVSRLVASEGMQRAPPACARVCRCRQLWARTQRPGQRPGQVSRLLRGIEMQRAGLAQVPASEGQRSRREGWLAGPARVLWQGRVLARQGRRRCRNL